VTRSSNSDSLPKFHRFIDEMGDTTFFGKGRKWIVGSEGVSLSFGLGLIKFKSPIEDIRQQVISLQTEVEQDPFLNVIPSVEKRIQSGGFFFHGCKDTPDVRSVFFRFIKELDCEAEIVVARKIEGMFEKRHQSDEKLFYAEVLSHLIKSRVKRKGKLILNVAERGSSTREKVLSQALEMALEQAGTKWKGDLGSDVVFNVQTPRTEPLLNVADYLCWAIQRVFERGETRFYDFLQPKYRVVVDLYDSANYEQNRNYYTTKNPLTSENKLDPQNT